MKQIEPARCKRTLERIDIDVSLVGAQEKFDGGRYLMHFTEKGVRLTSRHISKKTGLFVEKTENFPNLIEKKYFNKELVGTVLDGEIISPNRDVRELLRYGGNPETARQAMLQIGKCTYQAFDILYYGSHDIRRHPYKDRHKIINTVLKMVGNPYVQRPKIILGSQRSLTEYYSHVINHGGEGVILKDLTAPYGEGWWKLKKCQTYDFVIFGFTISDSADFRSKGWIGAIEFGLYNEEGMLIKTGQTSGMTFEEREEFSKNQKKYIGKVIEIAGQDMHDGVVRHPRFLRLRPDLNSEDQTFLKYRR